MLRILAIAVLSVWGAAALVAQPPAAQPEFEVATVKPVDPGAKAARFLTMQGADRFVVKDYTLQGLIAAAYDLNPDAVSGGPEWMQLQHFDIAAKTPGYVRPTREQQMAMLRGLLAERFGLRFHREQREFAIFRLTVAKGGAKLKESAAAAGEPSKLVSVVSPGKIVMPARNATMREFTLILQRAVLDRPVVDSTALAGRYDFDLTWAPDESQFGGEVGKAPDDAASAPLFTAMQEQLGLKLVATRGPVEALVVDGAERPTAD